MQSNKTEVHSIEAEQQVLGAILTSPALIGELQAHGGAGLFHDPVHGAIYELAAEKHKRGDLVSPVTMADWAKQHSGMQQLGGAGYLVRLAGAGLGRSQLPSQCEYLADLSAKRGIALAMHDALSDIDVGDASADVVLARLDAAIAKVSVKGQSKTISMMKAVTTAMERVLAATRGDYTGLVQTGIPSLDNLVGGFNSGELILLGGRPSMGKTTVALNLALNAARAGKRVIICSLEMDPEQLAVRALSEQTGQNNSAITYRDMLAGNLVDWQLDALGQAARDIAELPIEFLNRDFSDIGSMKAGVLQAQKALGGKADLLVIDYTQLLKSAAKGRYEQITEISIELKGLAGKMKMPIVALSQLSRALESREDKRPMLSDLRESGQLEQDADTVLFCYRDEYYLEREEPETFDDDAWTAWSAAMERARNRLEIIVAKQRQGPIGTAAVMCNVAINRIWER